jgi:integrase
MQQLSFGDIPDTPFAIVATPATMPLLAAPTNGTESLPEAAVVVPAVAVHPELPGDLAGVIAALQADRVFSPQTIRQWSSSIRTVAHGVGRSPGAIPAAPSALRAAVAEANPTLRGIKPKRWANARSEVYRAIEHLGIGEPRAADDLPIAWARLKDQLPAQTLRRRLSRFIDFCATGGITPDTVSADTMTAFHRHLDASPRVKVPKKALRAACVAWNEAVRTVPGWPAVTVPVPSWSKTYKLAADVLPASFEADLARLHRRLSVVDLLDENAPKKPLRPATLATMIAHLRELVAGAVHAGVPAETLTDLSALLSPTTLKIALRWHLDRRDGASSPGLVEMGHNAYTTAKNYCRLPAEDVAAIKAMVGRLGDRERGMTRKNRQRLAAFDDRRLVRALFKLPDKLEAMAVAKDPPRKGAVLMQTAILIELWLFAPMRSRNMRELEPERHIVQHGSTKSGVTFIEIEAFQMKTAEAMQWPLPEHVVARLNRYMTNWRPHLGGKTSPWLFPGRDPSKPKHGVSIAAQVGETIWEHLGVKMNPHLFRHLAGKLYLDLDPGNYEGPRRFLGHRDINTTTTYYTGLESAAAARLYDAKVLELVGLDDTAPKPRGRRGGGR